MKFLNWRQAVKYLEKNSPDLDTFQKAVRNIRDCSDREDGGDGNYYQVDRWLKIWLDKLLKDLQK